MSKLEIERKTIDKKKIKEDSLQILRSSFELEGIIFSDERFKRVISGADKRATPVP